MSADESTTPDAEQAGAEQADAGATEAAPPVLRVISGNPTDEEIAALVAVLAASSGSGDDAAAAGPRRSLWTDASRVPGARLTPGPGAWRASGRTLR